MAYEKELEFAKGLAKEAGVIMKRYFRADDIGTVWKSDDTPITIADTKINDLVIKQVKVKFPDHGVHGEEKSIDEGSEWMWICDPVDGTMPFSIGLPISAFSLALTHNGEVQLGVVYDPFCDRLFQGVKGAGAFLNGRAIRVSKQSMQNAYIGCDQWATPNTPPDDMVIGISKLRDALLEAGAKPLTPSAAVITSALIASGEVAGEVFAVTKPEDIAAVKVIVEEAGGKVTDLYGKDQRYDRPLNGAIVSNGLIHQDLIELVAKCVS